MTSLFRHPRGWFFGALARDLPSGTTLRTALAGQPIVLFRTEGGALGALDAHCPHLGAPLARGSVEGESLRCTLHGMRWSPDGTSAEGGCLRARAHPVIERHGFVFLHHDPDGLPPAFDIPALDTTRWTPLRMRVEEHDVPPVIMLEPHASDAGHNAFLHHERGVTVLEPFHIDGDHASGAIRMGHPLPAWSKPLVKLLGAGSWAITDVRSSTYGVGYQYNTSHVPAVGVFTHLFMLPVPVSPTRTRIHIGYALERFTKDNVPRTMRHVPPALLDRIFDPMGHRVFMEAIDEHVSMWSDQRMIDEPQLRPGEESVGQFRAWARRFDDERSGRRERGAHDAVAGAGPLLVDGGGGARKA